MKNGYKDKSLGKDTRDNGKLHTENAADEKPARKLYKKLAAAIKGEVYADLPTRYCYSTDASIYQVMPQIVVCPKDRDDVVACVKVAAEMGVPITARTAGTNLAGSCIGTGIIIDFSKYMNRILGMVEKKGRYFVDVEPGVINNTLQAYLKKHGLFLPPDPSSSEICMIGGNVGTKASGARSVQHGTMDDYLVGLEFVTAHGTVIDTLNPDTIPTHIASGLKEVRDAIFSDPETLERLRSKKDIKVASGYNLFAFLKYNISDGEDIGNDVENIIKDGNNIGKHGEDIGNGNINDNVSDNGNDDDKDGISNIITHLMPASVGTLGLFTRLRIEAVPIVKGTSISLVYFRDVREAGDAVQFIKKLGAVKIELMDSVSVGIVKGKYPQYDIPEGVSALFVEFDGEDRRIKISQMEELVSEKGYDISRIDSEADDIEHMENLWAVRKALVPLLTHYAQDVKPDAFIDDVSVSVSHLADLINDLHVVFDKYGIVSAIYGHAGSGNLHIRPMLNLNEPHNLELFPKLADDVYAVVFKYNGAMTGEHGMGRLRTMYLKQEWGERIYGHMARIKQIFDPLDLLNPDVMFSDQKITDNVKYPTVYTSGFEKPCINCGYCKSVCPISRTKKGERGARSFLQLMRLRESAPEKISDMPIPGHSANSTHPGQLMEEDLNDIERELSLCLGCLNCATRCPSHASVGDFVLSGRSGRAGEATEKMMKLWAGNYERFQILANIFGIIEPLVDNSISRRGINIVSRMFGHTPFKNGRRIPKFRKRPVSAHKQLHVEGGMSVALFAGCASRIIDDGTFEASLRVLNRSGFNVSVPQQQCCGLPMKDVGMMELAQKTVAANLDAFSDESIDAIVSICASCTMELKKLPEMFKDCDDARLRDKAKAVADKTHDIGEFLLTHLDVSVFDGTGDENTGKPDKLKKLDLKATYHEPCHLKHVGIIKEPRALIRKMVAEYEEMADGCCGGAGQYGFMHPVESDNIFGLKLESLKQIAPDVIVTTCPSCQEQLKWEVKKNGLECRVVNIVELMDMYYGING